MSGIPVAYARNITTTPSGSGITIDGLLIQNGSTGPLSNGSTGVSRVLAGGLYNTPLNSAAPMTGEILWYDGTYWSATSSISSLMATAPITASSQLTTKAYVDAATIGLNVHPEADVLADSTNTDILSAKYTTGAAGAGGSANSGLGVGATLTASTTNVALVVDSLPVQLNWRVLVNAFTGGSTTAMTSANFVSSTVLNVGAIFQNYAA